MPLRRRFNFSAARATQPALALRLVSGVLPAVAAALLLASAACAPGVPSDDPAVADTTRPYLPLWEVVHGGGTLHLLGSVHLLRPEVYPLDPAIYDAFDAADVVAFELDFAETAAAIPVMMQRGMYGAGGSLSDDLPADLYVELRARAEALSLPMEVVDRMKPWLVAMTLSAMVLQQGGFDAATGLDMHLHERAVAAGQEIVGLETVEEQIQVFEALSPEAQAAFLRSTLEELDDSVEMMDQATALWLRGDTDGLAAMFIESMEDQPQLMERLLYERNRAWVPEIEALLARPETVIVVVGVGHLAGQTSVIDLLRQRGYRVTQVRASQPAGAASP
jgi:uncharacterized protein